MKSFLLRSLLFFLILLGVDVLLFIFVFGLCDTFPPEERSLLENTLGSEGIILGTSHAEQGIVPSILEEETGLIGTTTGGHEETWFSIYITRRPFGRLGFGPGK